jgi:hypothetical protein
LLLQAAALFALLLLGLSVVLLVSPATQARCGALSWMLLLGCTLLIGVPAAKIARLYLQLAFTSSSAHNFSEAKHGIKRRRVSMWQLILALASALLLDIILLGAAHKREGGMLVVDQYVQQVVNLARC